MTSTGTPAENPSQSAREAVHLLAVNAVDTMPMSYPAAVALEDEVVNRLSALEARVALLEQRGRRMVRTLVQQRDGAPGQPILSISASRAFGLLADAVNEPVPPLPRAGVSADLVLVDEVVPAVVAEPEPTTVREALVLDGHQGTGIQQRPTLPALLPGEEFLIRERVPQDLGPARHRVYGALFRRHDGQEVLHTGTGGASADDVVPLDLVLPYLAAVRGAGFPAPARRLALLEAIRATHRR